jgi:hypothetical protein
MSLLMSGKQMLTEEEYSPTAWPESGTKRDYRAVLPVPQYLAPVVFQMEDFLQLKYDWNSYGAQRISRNTVEAALKLLVAYTSEIPIPEAFPTVKGGVKLEWGDDDKSVEMEFQPDGSISILIDESGEMTESTVHNLNHPAVFNALKWAEKLS